MSPRQLKDPRAHVRRGALMLTVLLFAGACTKAPSSGVNVKALTADFVFGVPPIETTAPPTLFDPPELDDEEFLPVPRPRPRPSQSPRVIVPCPAADPSKAEAIVSAIPDKVMPKEGVYRWKYAGYEFHPETRNPESETKIGSFIERQVVEVQQLEGEYEFTYSVVGRDPNLGGGRKKLVFHVSTGTPDNVEDVTGIYLTQIVSSPGSKNESFLNLNPAFRMLTLPAKGGEQIAARSVNNADFGVFEYTGLLQGKARRVDACGENVDAWNVDGTLKITYERVDPDDPASGSPQRKVVTDTFDFDYSFSVNLGGLLVFQHIEAPPCPIDSTKPSKGGTDEESGQETREGGEDPDRETGMFKCKIETDYYEYDLGIGQLKPDPLPPAKEA